MADTSSDTEDVDLQEFDQIYHLNDDEKSYVGRVSLIAKDGSPRGAEEREIEHFSAANRNEVRNCARLLTAAIIEKGANVFSLSILETVHKDKGAEREIFWINELDTVHPNGYNLMGGIGNRYSIHPETKELMRQSHKSFGKNAQKRFNIRVERKVVSNCIGYRGFFNGIPKGFFSVSLTEEEKKAKAIHYNLTGQTEYDRRVPRQRKHAAGDGKNITQPGVKANYNEYGRLTGYRANHPTRTELVSKTFYSLPEAVEYSKLLISFSEDETPEEYFTKKRPERPANMTYVKGPKPHKGSRNITKGTLVGYEVDIPATESKSGKKTNKGFMISSISLGDNLKKAIAYRDLHMKNSV